MPQINTFTPLSIIGNRLEFYIQEAIKDYPNKAEARDLLNEHIYQTVAPKRLTRLLNGSIEMSLHEALFFSGLFSVSVNQLILINEMVMPTADILLRQNIKLKKTG
jgi:hypothetical protein